MLNQTEIATAFRTTLIGVGTISAITSRIYYGRASETADLPYLITNHITTGRRIPQGTNAIYDGLWQLDAYAANPITLGSLTAGITGKFDNGGAIGLSTSQEISLVAQPIGAIEYERSNQDGEVLRQRLQYQLFSR